MKVFSIQSEKLLPGMFRIIFYGLKTIGLAPVSLHTKALTKNSRNTFVNVFLYSKMGLFYNLLLSALTLIMGALEIRNVALAIHTYKSRVNHVLDIVHYTLILCTAWCVIVYWAFKQKKAAYIMNRLSDVHCLLSAPEEKLFNKKTFIFLVMHTTFSVLVFISFVISTLIYKDSLIVAIALFIPVFINYWFLVEYSMVLGYLARELESLNANLLTLKEFPNDSFLTFLPNCDRSVLGSPTDNELANIKLLHSVRTTLYEVSQDVADLFSLPILPLVLLFFCVTVWVVYYVILSVLIPGLSRPTIYYIWSAAWLSIGFYPIILLCSFVTKTTKEAELTGQLVHKLLATAMRREVITELRLFSLHLIHEHVSFTAYGFFTLDFTLLQSILGAGATYLIIMIQFALQYMKT